MDNDNGFQQNTVKESEISKANESEKQINNLYSKMISEHPDQWYSKNSNLMRTEISIMRKRFPQSSFSFLKANGNMFWVLQMNITHTTIVDPWTFMLIYEKNHPFTHSYGGSIKIVPIKPRWEDLQQRAKEAGRPGVPHIIRNDHYGVCLCTRIKPDSYDSVSNSAASAVTAAACAADWALHFEIGLHNKDVWNHWCENTGLKHYKHLLV